MLDINYIILFWAILLIIFIIYCIYRMKDNMIPQPNSQAITKSITTKSMLITNPNITLQTSRFSNTTEPTNQNIIQYLDNLQKNDKIIDLPGCENVYDDNIAVRSLGYNSCATAYNDYYNRNLDPNKLYGNTKSLANICPVTTKSDKYMECMKLLLNKFNTNQVAVAGINQDLTNILNQRLQDRTNILANIETDINPYLNNKDLVDFNNHNLLGENINPSSSDILKYVNNYYQNKYGSSISLFTNLEEAFTSPTNILTLTQSTIQSSINTPTPTMKEIVISNGIMDPYITNIFFGRYIPVKGQYIAFNDLTLVLDYDITSLNPDSRNMVLNILDDNNKILITFKIGDISYFQTHKNVIKINITDKKIMKTDGVEMQTIQQLMMVLGLTSPSRIYMSLEKITSTENKVHITYKLLNTNMDTIMMLNKVE